MKKILVLLLMAILCPVSLFAQPDPVLATAETDCGPRNTRVRINWSQPFTGSIESGRLRYGGGNLTRSCFGQGPNCTDLGGQCIQTEAERQEAIKMLLALTAGRCDPPRGTLFPSEQTIYDWTLSLIGTRQTGMDVLRQRYLVLGCGAVQSTDRFACPTGMECRPPCPACPVCPSCPPVVDACVPTSGTLPPESVALFVWDARTTPAQMYRGKRIGDKFVLVSGASLAVGEVRAWMLLPVIE